MKFVKFILSLSLVIALSGVSPAQTIVDFNFTDTQGNSHQLFDYLGKKQAVIIDFFLTSCGSCGASMGELNDVYVDYGSNTQWVKVLAIECDTSTNAEIDNYMSSNGGTFPAMGGLDAHNYWKNNWQPLLGGQFNQIIGLFPTQFTNPSTTPFDYFKVGIFTPTDKLALQSKLTDYNFHMGVESGQIQQDSLTVFPNPVQDVVNYSLYTSKSSELTLNIKDISGKIIKTENIGSVTDQYIKGNLNVSDLASGFYFLEVVGNEVHMMEKIIISR